jgi:hypothetical protein
MRGRRRGYQDDTCGASGTEASQCDGLMVAIIALMAVIFIWDLFVPLGVAMGLLYVVPVMMTLWLPGRWPTVV